MEQKPEKKIYELKQNISREIGREDEKFWIDCCSEITPHLNIQIYIKGTVKCEHIITKVERESFFWLNVTIVDLGMTYKIIRSFQI